METPNRNKPGKWVVASFLLLILVIISYLIIMQVFPNLFMTMPTGDAQPVQTTP